MKESQIEGFYIYAQDFLDIELYLILLQETLQSVGLSVVAVFLVLLFITADLTLTFMVAFCVILVDFFLIALIHYWSFTFNSLVMIFNVLAIGLSVDYSAHIAHCYTSVEVPASIKGSLNIRKYKAEKSLAVMGSSIFHGGMSTFCAIIVTGFTSTYVFMLFFKCFVGIITFGMANGFFLLPVLLTFFGPLTQEEVDRSKPKNEDDKNKSNEYCETARELKLNLGQHKKEAEVEESLTDELTNSAISQMERN